MLKNTKHFEDLNNLPSNVVGRIFESFKDEVRHKNRWRRWYRKRASYHKIGDYNPWTVVNRMIENNIGKPFSVVFSNYCHLAPWYQQRFFLEEFDTFRYGYNDYYIDDKGLIQTNNTNYYKGPYTFYSEDYREEERHILTGKTKPKYGWWEKGNNKDHLYKSVIVSGFSKTFESKNNPLFKRLTAEKLKTNKQRIKKQRKQPSISEQDFRRILQERQLKEREENLIKILKHGFDPITSFRKRKKQKENE